MLPIDVDDILHVSSLAGLTKLIQLSLGPVFLLSAMGTILNMLTGRLSRIIDRARYIEDTIAPSGDPQRRRQVGELKILDKRIRIVNMAIFLVTASAVMLCTVVAAMFLARLAGFGFARTLALCFALCLLLLIAGLALFLIEVRVGVAAFRVRDELLRSEDPNP